MENIIYLDNAATTKCLPNVRDIVEKYSNDFFYNPSSVYMGAVQVRKDLENARKELLNLLGASNHKLLFLSGATEANNLIFNSLNLRAGDKILVSVGEHPSVYNRAIKERERGIVVDFINLNSDGTVDIDDLKSKLDEKVKLVSCMYVSNETGAVNDIKKICKIVKSYNSNICFACDGVQSFGKINVNLDMLGVDYFVLSAHKIHGPKGIGALVYNKQRKIVPLLYGGGQEENLRSGTENVAGIMGLHAAAKHAIDNLKNNFDRVSNLKQNFKIKIIDANIGAIINADNETSSPYILSISIPNIRGEVLLHMLEGYGIYISTGSACSSKHSDNRILEAMGRNKTEVMGSIRISFNAIDKYDIDYIASKIIDTIKELKGKIN